MFVCARAAQPIGCNGDHRKTEWARAEWWDLVDVVTGERPVQRTSAKMLWDDRFLYVMFRCFDAEVVAGYTDYNDPIFLEDVVEVFLDDNSSPRDYIEIELSPANVLLHYAVHNDSAGNVLTFARTRKVIETAVRRSDGDAVWYGELAIPFSELILSRSGHPLPGDKWRFNLYRIDRRHDAEDEYSALFPTGKIGFHVPDSFGELSFAR